MTGTQCADALDPALIPLLSVAAVLIGAATVWALLRAFGRWAVTGFRPGVLLSSLFLAPLAAVALLIRWATVAMLSSIGRRVVIAGILLLVASTAIIKLSQEPISETQLAAHQSGCQRVEAAQVLFQVQWNTKKKYYKQKRFNKDTKWVEYETSLLAYGLKGQGVTRAQGIVTLDQLTAKVDVERRSNKISAMPAYQSALDAAKKWILAGAPGNPKQPDGGRSRSFYLKTYSKRTDFPPDTRIDVVPERGNNFVA